MSTAKRIYPLVLGLAALGGGAGMGCDSHVLNFPGDAAGFECGASPAYYADEMPIPENGYEAQHPSSECRYYQQAVFYFAYATRTLASGDLALATYPTIDDTFTRAHPLADGALAPSGAHRGTAQRAWLGNVKQPGDDSILVDQSGHAIYYGVSVNPAFVDFVTSHQLETATGIQNADPNLIFAPGVAAYRSAWKDIDPADGVTGDFSSFLTTDAWVSTLRADPVTGTITEDKDHPRHIRVALLAIELAYSLGGHPELTWATFQHVAADGSPDVAPSAPAQPTGSASNAAPSSASMLLYHANTPASLSNQPAPDSQLRLDDTTQTFAQTTSVYRLYPASRSNTTEERAEVKALNQVTLGLPQSLAPPGTVDLRGAYALMGALWMDKPAYFGIDKTLQNDVTSPFVTGDHVDQDGNSAPAIPVVQFQASLRTLGTDSPYSILAGQDRLSNPAIESFTQGETFNNCLACHNTQAISARGLPAPQDPSQPTLIGPKLINVSRVFSQFVLEECGPSGVCP